jgi:DNA-binding PucR family transcriptional regulator
MSQHRVIFVVDEAVVTEAIAQIAGALTERSEELTVKLIEHYARELPNLVNDDPSVVSLLSSSLHQNIDTGLRIFQHGIDPTRVEAPAAAMEYARRLAQRGTPVIDLIRAYYLGQTDILNEAFDEGVRQIDDSALMGEMMRRALTVTFLFIDRVTQQVITAYQEERDRWLLNRSAVRAARVRALLDGDGGLDENEDSLGYRLRGRHLAMVLWRGDDVSRDGALSLLEEVASELRTKVSGEGKPLFVPYDELVAFAWLPLATAELPEPTDVEQVLADAEEDVRIAFGDPGEGLEGFRNSHRQALRVRSLAVAAGEHAERALTFRDVGSIALMSSDLGSTKTWVTEILGHLATDDEQHERLRSTLRVFLATGSSYTAAASRLTMHKNSVQYRVRKAEEALPRPVTENRLDVELALNLCHRLRGAVLTKPSGRAAAR